MTDPLQKLREWLPLLPLLLILAAAYWLNQQVQPLPDSSSSEKRHDPDFIIDKFTATTYDEQGTPRFLMTAQKMTHYPDNDSTHLEEPRLTSFFPERPAVYATAKRGEVSSKGEEVFLHDDVRVVRAATPRQGEMVLTTSYLHVVPERDVADTNQPVTMTESLSVVHSVGMRLDHKIRTVQLLSQVKGYYAPAKR
ncbi:MAG: LPS export ABC transporter periplasmic protein LptC [Gallionellaceae bacterium]|nr:LPS export ABC transporter periplasmic protein LptC [Gallionellaceae bacterium]